MSTDIEHHARMVNEFLGWSLERLTIEMAREWRCMFSEREWPHHRAQSRRSYAAMAEAKQMKEALAS